MTEPYANDIPVAYHPDPEINAGVAADMLEAERADLVAGYPPRRWTCPVCSTAHGRGHFGAIGIHRCLKCGYTGTGGVMEEEGAPASPPPLAPAPDPVLRQVVKEALQSEACRLREERDRAIFDLEAARVERDAAVQAVYEAERHAIEQGELRVAAEKERDEARQHLAAARARIAQLGELASKPVETSVLLAEETTDEELPEGIPCPEVQGQGMIACGEAVHGPGRADPRANHLGSGSCPRAAECHQVVLLQAPAVAQLAAEAGRVAGL